MMLLHIVAGIALGGLHLGFLWPVPQLWFLSWVVLELGGSSHIGRQVSWGITDWRKLIFGPGDQGFRKGPVLRCGLGRSPFGDVPTLPAWVAHPLLPQPTVLCRIAVACATPKGPRQRHRTQAAFSVHGVKL
jgi:hypothetical protein